MLYSIKILVNQPTRFILTVTGISLCLILMLFLAGIYKGVADGSVDYIRENKVDLWVLQKNTTNILRGTSFLSHGLESAIMQNPNVESVSPVLLILATIKNSNKRSTIFLAGYNPKMNFGGPPKITGGKMVELNNEIVLDESFAKKNGFKVGDKIFIMDDTLTVTGLSRGTNAFVIQYAFTTLNESQNLLGFPGIVTCYLVKLKKGIDRDRSIHQLKETLKNTSIYTYDEFLANNIKEMESGFLPILFAVAALGAIVLTTVLSLILSINILEKKKDFAVMKILGAPSVFLPKIIIQQALIICTAAGTLCVILYFPLVKLIETLSPEVNTKTTIYQVAVVFIIGLMMGVVSSLISLKRLRKIYPLEVFYEK